MSEQFIKLANLANEKIGLTFKLEDAKQLHELLEAYGQLIVAECADVGERYADGNYEVRNQILARFGMEEDEE